MTAAAIAGCTTLVGAVTVRWCLAVGTRGLTPIRAWPRLVPPRVVRAWLADAAPTVAPDLAWPAWLAGTALLTLVAAAAGGPGLGVLVVAVATGGPAVWFVAAHGRTDRLVDVALPEALDGVARSLRSGATLRAALVEAVEVAPGRLGDELRVVVTDAEGGMPVVAALESWVERCATPGVRLAGTALLLAAESGGAAARAVDGVASTLRANLAVAAEVRAHSSQARLSGLVIGAAPLVFGVLAAGTDGRTATFLLRTPAGVACLAAGLALDGVGAWWMHRITVGAA